MTESNTEPLVVDVPTAGRLLGLSRGAAYQAVWRGELPVIRIGRLLRVPRAALQRLLDAAEPQPRNGARDDDRRRS